jgi:hypothetical protein
MWTRCLSAVIVAAFAAGLSVGPATAAVVELSPDGSDSVSLDNVMANDDTVRVGDKDFDFRSTSYQANGGAALPADSDILLRGSDDADGDFGLQFQLNGFRVGSNQSVDALVQFEVTANKPGLMIDGVSMTYNGGAATGTGVATISENALFEEGGSPALSENLGVADQPDPGSDQLQDEASLIEPSKSIFITKDIGTSGHTDGTADISGFTQHFSQVPEPTSLALFGTGLVLLGSAGRRRRQQQ